MATIVSRHGRGLAVGVLAALLLAGCVTGSGPVVSELRDVRAFTRLEVGSGIQVEATAGGSVGLAVRAQQNVLPVVATEVRANTLTVDAREDFTSTVPVTVVVSTPALEAVSMTGGAVVRVAQADGDTIELDVRGGSHLTVSGHARHVSLVADGGSIVELGDLVAQSLEVRLGGGASATVQASERVTGSASGGASLSVSGDAMVDIDTSGGAAVTQPSVR